MRRLITSVPFKKGFQALELPRLKVELSFLQRGKSLCIVNQLSDSFLLLGIDDVRRIELIMLDHLLLVLLQYTCCYQNVEGVIDSPSDVLRFSWTLHYLDAISRPLCI